MERNLVLEDKEGKVVRVFAWDGGAAKVIRRADTSRLELVKDTTLLEQKKINFQELGQIDSSLTTQKPYLVGSLGHLKIVEAVEATHKDNENPEETEKLWWMSVLAMIFLFSAGLGVLKFAPETTPKLEEELKQQVVKIVKNIPKPETVKMKQQANVQTQTTNKVAPSKVAGLKRMGALSALGSLSSGKNKGGLDIGAAQSSAGPGLGGGTQGSGGVQTSLYAKGVVGAALGAGNNVNGAGGYGTKGKGGGQAGYGKLALTGSTGATPIPLGAEASVAKGLDRDQIAAVINRNLGQVRFCYEQGLQGNAGLNGRVAVAFVIGGSGLVKSANVDSSNLNSKAVEDCIVMRLKTWKFPVPEGGVDVEVTYPFVLRRSGQG